MKNILVTLLLNLLFFIPIYSQNNPAPEYLNNKLFSKDILEYQLVNLEEEKTSLKEIIANHKDKKIILDFWASWCRDCIKDFPSAKKLKSKTKNTDYVYISLDKTITDWKTGIENWNIEGDHYYLAEGWKSKLAKYIDLDWIPRYLVLDERGIIVVPKEVTISSKRIEKIVN